MAGLLTRRNKSVAKKALKRAVKKRIEFGGKRAMQVSGAIGKMARQLGNAGLKRMGSSKPKIVR